MTARPLAPLALLVALQVLDVLVHVATGQFEPLRVTGNVIISAGAAAAAVSSSLRIGAALAGAVYLGLNVVFVGQHGMVNPATEAVRFPLFGFVLGSLVLLAWLLARTSPGRGGN